MKNVGYVFIAMMSIAFAFPGLCMAHAGRRFEVKTEQTGGMEKLYVQGYNSSGSDDGGGVTRPYTNSIHDHWSNIFGSATTGLPSFDVIASGSLEGFGLYAELVGVTKWVDPPLMDMGGMMMVPSGTVPVLEPLTTENLFVAKDSQMVSNTALGTLMLDDSIASAGEHLDLVYGINLEPSSVLYAVEWILSTDAPGVMPSDSIYAILSPDGANMTEKMHMESLYLESYLGNGGGGGMIMVPEPASVMILVLSAIACVATVRRGIPGGIR